MAEKLSYEIVGKGDPLVCLHAYGLDHTEWMQVAEILKEDFTLILPDIRGHGDSPSPTREYSMLDLAGDVIVMLDQLEINQAYYAGHSMGGYIMLALAKRYPEEWLVWRWSHPMLTRIHLRRFNPALTPLKR